MWFVKSLSLDIIFFIGIRKERIVSAIGYGEDQLLNNCDDAIQITVQKKSINVTVDLSLL